MDDPTREAVNLLRAELAHLEARNLAPTERAVIARMIERRAELRPVFECLWTPAHIRPHHERGGLVFLAEPIPGWPEVYTREQFDHELSMERRRLLQVIIGTAATVPDLAKDRRDALRELPELLDDFGHHAQALAKTLERLTAKAHRGGLALPGWLSDPIELTTQAAAESGPDSFDLIARPDLETLADRYARHLSDLQAMVDHLATVTRADLQDATPRFHEFTRQANPLGDYARSLLQALTRYWRAAVFLEAFEFTAPELVTLAAAMCDMDPDELPTDPERLIRDILRAHRGG